MASAYIFRRAGGMLHIGAERREEEKREAPSEPARVAPPAEAAAAEPEMDGGPEICPS
jgi:hypothetical protein